MSSSSFYFSTVSILCGNFVFLYNWPSKSYRNWRMHMGYLTCLFVCLSVCWCFQPSQSQRIISRVKTNFNLLATLRTLNHSFSTTLLKYFTWKITEHDFQPSERNRYTAQRHILWSLIYNPRAPSVGTCIKRLSLTLSTVTYFIVRAYEGTCSSHS